MEGLDNLRHLYQDHNLLALPILLHGEHSLVLDVNLLRVSSQSRWIQYLPHPCLDLGHL